MMNQPMPSSSTINSDVKQTPLPNELIATVDSFKKFLINQKQLLADLDQLSQQQKQPNSSLKSDLEKVGRFVSNTGLNLHRMYARSERLKQDLAKEERYATNAQKAFESTGSNYTLQASTAAPNDFFLVKLAEFNSRLRSYKQELEALEDAKGLVGSGQQSCPNSAAAASTPSGLVDLLKRMDEEFVGLASQLYSVSEQVKQLKAEYIRSNKLPPDAFDQLRHPPALSSLYSNLGGGLGKFGGGGLSSLQTKPRRRQAPYGPSPFGDDQLERLGLASPANQLATNSLAATPLAAVTGGVNLQGGTVTAFGGGGGNLLSSGFNNPTSSSSFGFGAGGLINKPTIGGGTTGFGAIGTGLNPTSTQSTGFGTSSSSATAFRSSVLGGGMGGGIGATTTQSSSSTLFGSTSFDQSSLGKRPATTSNSVFGAPSTNATPQSTSLFGAGIKR